MNRPARIRLLAFLAGVFALKLLVLFQLKDHPLLQADAGLDTSTYADLARQVVAGDIGLGPGLYYVLPLYIYVLAAGLAVFDSFTAVKVVQIVLGTASVACIWFTARAWFNERAAWIAAALAALTGLFTFYEVIILQASVDAFLTSFALWALTRALIATRAVGRVLSDPARAAAEIANGGSNPPSREALRRVPRSSLASSARAEGERTRPTGPASSPQPPAPSPWPALLAGVTFGLQTLNRPQVLLAAAGIAALLLATRRLRVAALVAAGIAAGMAPVAVRNLVVSHQWSLVSSHGGLNLYIGNGDAATGFYRNVPGIRPTIAGQAEDVRRVAQKALGRPVTDAEASGYFVDLATTWMRQHPLDALALFAKKLFYVFNAQHVALPHSYPFYAYEESTALRFYAIGPWLLMPLGLVGLLVPLIDRGVRLQADRSPTVRLKPDATIGTEPPAPSPYWIWFSFVPFYAASVALFFVAERYRLPLLPPLCVGAGAAVDAAIRAVAARRVAAGPAMAGALFAVLFAAANWRTGLHDGRWEEGLRLAQRLAILGRLDEAKQWAERIERLEPRPGATAYGVGMQMLLNKQPAAALDELTRAQRLDPGAANVAYGLGQALLESGRAAEAVPHLKRGFDAGIELPRGGYDYAAALTAAGDTVGAAAALRRMQPPDPEDPEGWLTLGRQASEMKQPEVAEAFFRRAAAMRPDQASARQQFGLNLLVLNRCEEAAVELAAASRLDPRNPDSLSHLAYCEAKLGRLADARAHAEAALAINPGDPLGKQLMAALGRK